MKFKSFLPLALLLSITFDALAKDQTLSELDISMVTPEGFSKADNFNGFIQPESFATIKAGESIKPIADMIDSFLQNTPAITSRENVKISNKKGLLVKSNKTLNGNNFELWTLLFGDKISTITITASYPQHLNKGLSPALKTSLLSTRWLRLPSEQMFNGMPFVLDQSKDLQIVKRTANSVVMINKAPFDPQKSVTPLLVVSSVASDKELVDIQNFARQQLANKRFESNIGIEHEEEIKINGIRAYHITAKAIDKQTGLPVTLFQTIAFQPYKYLLIQGMTEQTHFSHFGPQFEQIAASVKFKVKQ
jgi:hypothetical protein